MNIEYILTGSLGIILWVIDKIFFGGRNYLAKLNLIFGILLLIVGIFS